MSCASGTAAANRVRLMDETSRFQSLFSQNFDRAIFGVYFLGAIAPLLALAVVAQQYVFPVLENESYGVAGLVGLISGVGGLTLACFFALRRIARGALDQMDADNTRLTKLLRMSRELSNAPHTDVVVETAAQSALALLDARAAFVLLRSGASKELALSEAAGQDAQDIYAAHAGLFQELVETAEAQGGRAALSSSASADLGASQHPLSAAVAITLSGDAGKSRGALIVAQAGARQGFSSSELDSVSTLSSLTSVAMENARLQDTQRNFFAHVTEIVVAALDEHIEGRNGHATAVAQLANRLGRELGFEGDDLQRLHFASLLHDIGMLKVDRDRQQQPSEFRKHATLGHRMLSRIRLWEDIAPIVHHHHEFYDGTGYPEGLSGEQIPLESRVILVADAFDAMSRSEGTRRARSLEEILEEFQSGAGGQFDPKVVEAFAAIAERGEISCDP
jgi:putative nucleotidyltransferase with HDIG domain